MAVDTVTVTATMDFQDGQPFDGVLEFRLNAASKTDEALVGPRLGYQTAVFEDGVATVEAVPNSMLEEGTFYRVKVWSRETVSGNLKSRTKMLDAVAVVPDSDCNLRDIITVAPTTPSSAEAVQALISEAMTDMQEAIGTAEAAAQSARDAADSIASMTSEEVENIFAEGA